MRPITVAMRDVLIAHIDLPQKMPSGRDENSRYTTARAVTFGWLEPEPHRPGWTRITERGRRTLARALADWAHSIERARRATERKWNAVGREPFPATSSAKPLTLLENKISPEG